MEQTILAATGRYLPEQVIDNCDLTQFSEEARRMIGPKTGVYSRRYALESECTSDLAVRAAMDCLKKVDLSPMDIEGIILATSSPDRMQPATATRLQHLIGACNAFAFDINSVCSGSVFGIAMADALIRAGKYRNILFVAAEMYSKISNHNDFSSCPFFGDGAGAMLFQAETDASRGVLHSCLRTDGSRSDTICVPGGGTMMPYGKMASQKSACFRMKGMDVFAFAIEKAPEIIHQLLNEAGVSVSAVKRFICHQASRAIIEKISGMLAVPSERFHVNLDRYGNTAGASVPIALDEAITEGLAMRDDLVVTVAFGGGLSWGANLIRL